METPSVQEIDEESHSPVDNDPNLLHAIAGRHPVKSVRNVAWADHAANRLARFNGFPAQRDLVQLKQQVVDAFESGSGAMRTGWSVAWKPFDEQGKTTLRSLTERLRKPGPNSSVDHELAASSMQKPNISNGSAQTLPGPTTTADLKQQPPKASMTTDADQEIGRADEHDNVVVFDTILISPAPREITTESLQSLPIGELTANPAFCFLWVRDSSQFDSYLGMMEGWGFRQVETVVWFASPEQGSMGNTSSLSYQGMQETSEYSGSSALKELLDLCNPSDCGVNIVDFDSFTRANPGLKDEWSITTDAWGAGGGFQYLRDIPQNSSLFRRTARYCLLGINGKVKRSTDGRIANSNIDPDVILSKDCVGSPPLLFDLIENLALGCRRLHIFGNKPRRGWVTVGPEVLGTDFDIDSWNAAGEELGWLVKMNHKIEEMRPKSPEPDADEDKDYDREFPLDQIDSEFARGTERGAASRTDPTSLLDLDLDIYLPSGRVLLPTMPRHSSDTYGVLQDVEPLNVETDKIQTLNRTSELQQLVRESSVQNITRQQFVPENFGGYDLYRNIPRITVHQTSPVQGVHWTSAERGVYESPLNHRMYESFSERALNAGPFESDVAYSDVGMHVRSEMPCMMSYNPNVPNASMSGDNTVDQEHIPLLSRLVPLDQYIASLNVTPTTSDTRRANSYTPAEWISRVEGLRLYNLQNGCLRLHGSAAQAWFIALNNMRLQEREYLESLRRSHSSSEALRLRQTTEHPDFPPPRSWREAENLHPYYQQLISDFIVSFGQLIGRGQYEESSFRALVEEQIDIFFMEMISLWGMIGDDRI